jgi:hypothetical protein
MALPTKAPAWGERGHRMVALIAEHYLTDKSRQAISELLKRDPFLKECAAKKYAVTSLSDMLACIAPWPDPPLKFARPYTSNWHFVDIPTSFSHPQNPAVVGYDEARDCKTDDARGDCAILALKRFRVILANGPTASDDMADYREAQTSRAEALKFIVHIIGDLHQPLHAVTDKRNINDDTDIGDMGGNLKIVSWLGADINPRWKDQWNLHSVWDEGIIDHTMDVRKISESEYLQILLKSLPAQGSSEFANLQAGTTLIWTNESYLLAVKNAYGKLPPFDKNYKYQDKKGERSGGYRLDQSYYDLNSLVVDQQLMRAGVRLAKYLNETLDPPKN